MDEQPDDAPVASGALGPGKAPGVLGDSEAPGRDEVPGGSGDRMRDDGPEGPGLPLLPGFREMALRRMSAERRRLVADLTAQRRSAGLSQTEVAARMGTSQSAVARLETGDADVRVSTLERYAAAIGSQVSWQARPGRGQRGEGHPGLGRASRSQPGKDQPGLERAGQGPPGQTQPSLTEPGPPQPGSPQAAPLQAELGQEYR
jgi:transcriptional regulator with XRE-family HTH domain